MRIDNPASERLAGYYRILDERAAGSAFLQWVKYLDLGTCTVRLVNYSAAFTPHVEKQLGYVLKDTAPSYDATLVIWRENAFDTLLKAFQEQEEREQAEDEHAAYLRRRIEKIRGLPPAPPAQPFSFFQVFDQSISRHMPLIDVQPVTRYLEAQNPESRTWYYAVDNLEPEEFIKRGHIFVQTFNRLLKSNSAGLVHGAAVGLDGKGILFCARGQRGKSTLAVQAMLDGFDYVSDDYLVLGKEEGGLYAWPIYSIITLSAMMWGDLYRVLDAKFVSNNGRKDKYVFDIEKYHPRFVSRYPITCCMFPQVVSEPEPNIVRCTQAGKGRAITQLVHSTINQMGDRHDIATIKKWITFVRDLPCYQINLCRDISKNLRCLRDFLENGTCGQQVNQAGMLHSRAIPGNILK